MIGYPKTLSTKQDYEYVRNHFDRELWIKDFQNLLDTRMDWFFVKDLESPDDGITDETHKVVEMGDMDADVKQYAQYEYRENPLAKIFRVGYTVEEVEALVGVFHAEPSELEEPADTGNEVAEAEAE